MFFTNLFCRRRILSSFLILLTITMVGALNWLLINFQSLWIAGFWGLFWLLIIFLIAYYCLIIVMPLDKAPFFILFSHRLGLSLLIIVGFSLALMSLIIPWNWPFLGALLIVALLLIILAQINLMLLEKMVIALEDGNLRPKKYGLKYSLQEFFDLKELTVILKN